MADEFAINIKGINEVCASLDKMPTRIVKGAYARALAAAAVPVVEALLARIGQFKDATGDLEAHLVTDISIQSEGKGGEVQIGFGKRGYIARFVEYGHRDVGHKPAKKELGNIKPYPFMRPATETSADAAVDAFANSIRESVDGGLK